MNADQQRACREAFDKAGYWPNEVLWKAWQQAWEAALAKTPITENDLRWRFLEHGCQWVSFTPLGGQTRAFDPRDVSAHGLLGLRKFVDDESAKQLTVLRAGAAELEAKIAQGGR
jgi:hypothetical protein